MQMVIKAADLSHVARELPYHVEWVQRITLEQNSQVDAEKSLGLPFMPFMDRDQGFPSFLKSQKGFMSLVAKPILEPLMPFMHTSVCLEMLDRNLGHWQQLYNVEVPDSRSHSQTQSRADSRSESPSLPPLPPSWRESLGPDVPNALMKMMSLTALRQASSASESTSVNNRSPGAAADYAVPSSVHMLDLDFTPLAQRRNSDH